MSTEDRAINTNTVVEDHQKSLRLNFDNSADGIGLKKVAKATFDFDVQGGAIGAYKLGVQLPDNAIITRCWYDVLTTFTSATDSATIAIHANSANDLVSVLAISGVGDIWDAGLHEGIPVDTAATMVKLTAARDLTLTIAVDAITAGKLILVCEYIITG